MINWTIPVVINTVRSILQTAESSNDSTTQVRRANYVVAN